MLKKYEISVITVGELKLTKLVKRGTDIQFLTESEIFDAIHEEHLSTGHGGGRNIVHNRTQC